MNPDLTSALARIVQAALPRAQAVYLFGSATDDSLRPDSDVDVAVLMPPGEDAAEVIGRPGGLRVDLADSVHRAVDVVDLRRASTVLKKEVVVNGQRIATRDARAADEFELLVLSLYQKLNQERADIVAEGLRSGSFHAVE